MPGPGERTAGAGSEPGARSSEDQKLVVLARAARARAKAAEGAAVRDSDGRTYAAGAVTLPSLRLSAVQVCAAMAVSSGSRGLEAVVVLSGTGSLSDQDSRVVADLGGDGVTVHLL